VGATDTTVPGKTARAWAVVSAADGAGTRLKGMPSGSVRASAESVASVDAAGSSSSVTVAVALAAVPSV